MDIFIIRHAKAGSREIFSKKGKPDRLRPLTKNGKQDFINHSRSLKKAIGSLDLIIYSPYLRTKQTAEILASQYNKLNILSCSELEPHCKTEQFIEWLRPNLKRKYKHIAIVGHDPNLSHLIQWLVFKENKINSFMELKKGSCVALDSKDILTKGNSQIKWIVSPQLLSSIK